MATNVPLVFIISFMTWKF